MGSNPNPSRARQGSLGDALARKHQVTIIRFLLRAFHNETLQHFHFPPSFRPETNFKHQTPRHRFLFTSGSANSPGELFLEPLTAVV